MSGPSGDAVRWVWVQALRSGFCTEPLWVAWADARIAASPGTLPAWLVDASGAASAGEAAAAFAAGAGDAGRDALDLWALRIGFRCLRHLRDGAGADLWDVLQREEDIVEFAESRGIPLRQGPGWEERVDAAFRPLAAQAEGAWRALWPAAGAPPHP